MKRNNKPFLLALSFLAFISAPAFAQDAAPGDSCTGLNNTYVLSGGPENSGTGHLLSCNGTNWVKVFSFDTTGVIQPQFTNTGSCGDGDTLVYNAATGGMTCNTACSDNTPNSFNFTDNAAASASTSTTSNILQITGINCQVNATISGEGSPELRTCSNGTSVANCDGSLIQDWTSNATAVNENDYIQIRLTSSAAGGDTFTANLTVGGAVDAWNVTPTGNCTDPSPAPGTVCADGTVFAGFTPDGGGTIKMYTTRCDEMVDGLDGWTGSACRTSRVALPWNNGNNGDWVDTPTNNSVTGQANTAALDGLDSDDDATGTAGFQPHQAAQRCADLDRNGHTDWYLPAEQELDVLYQHNGAIGNFNTGGSYYWSSTEVSTSLARRQRFSDGFQNFNASKITTLLVRCVRR